MIRAAATAQREQRVFSHQSAAALWGLPNIGPWPDDVHLLVPKTTGGRSDPGVRRHALGVDDRDVTVIDGIAVTTLARTLVDLAATSPVYSAVAALDAAFFTPRFGSGPLITRDAVLDQWDRQGPFRGFRRAHRLIEFAETGAASPSESGSRVTMAVLGFPAPELQHHFLVDGGDAWTDFFWESVRGVGECDGETKYEDPEFLRGRSVAEVVRAEKRREDAIRRQVRGFQRWGSAEAFSPRALRPQLLELGLVPGVPRLRGR
ncbi:hypothetical protein [Antiquaquibacter soli]|uniref:Uncharacterized protein n=1 Tax=Antiquaquibacter soli TaxID=3064523 RepID=A0ABT9BQY3_9MICO|nr:hypothetical protein [Protaetiibacter sp. WY-16]MDO7882862.1 hypothetical protein [Protaetiibacter sp. WY-16]